jgi:hypothetical protein
MPINTFDHRGWAGDDLRDGPIQNISYWLGQVPVPGAFAGGVRSSITSATSGIAATETLVVNIPLVLPGTAFGQTTLGTLNVGTLVRATFEGTCTVNTGAGAGVFTLRMGTLGTKSDASIASASFTSAASGSNIPFRAVLDMTIQTLQTTASANGTAYGYVAVENTGVTGIVATTNTVIALSGITAMPTQTATYLDITYTGAASGPTTTFQNATIEVIP